MPAEPDPNNPTAEAGVYDVKSGSDATALDGTKYADDNVPLPTVIPTDDR